MAPLTFAMRPAAKPSSGLIERMTRVSFQPLTKPMTKPVMKVVNDWMSIPSLSPMPSLIFKMSLKRDDRVYDKTKQFAFFDLQFVWDNSVQGHRLTLQGVC